GGRGRGAEEGRGDRPRAAGEAREDRGPDGRAGQAGPDPRAGERGAPRGDGARPPDRRGRRRGREVARRALERLIQDGRIHPARIEEVVEKVREELWLDVKTTGEAAAFEFGIADLHPEVVKLLGRLKYRTSYGQSVLQHSKEVGWAACHLASELGADVAVAKRAGLLHDIGKAI